MGGSFRGGAVGGFLWGGSFGVTLLGHSFECANKFHQQDYTANQDFNNRRTIESQPVDAGKGQEEQTGHGIAQGPPYAGIDRMCQVKSKGKNTQ